MLHLCHSAKALNFLMDILHAITTTSTKALRVPSKKLDNVKTEPPKKLDPASPLPINDTTRSPADPEASPSVQPSPHEVPPLISPTMPHTSTTMALQPPLHCSPHNHPGHQVVHAQIALPTATASPLAPHWALCGNVFNPDTGKLAKYAELSCSSKGHLWHTSSMAEIHCLAQGTATIPGTKIMHIISVSQLPHGIKATYLCIACAY